MVQFKTSYQCPSGGRVQRITTVAHAWSSPAKGLHALLPGTPDRRTEVEAWVLFWIFFFFFFLWVLGVYFFIPGELALFYPFLMSFPVVLVLICRL
jgi:hypothetical protein